MRSLPYWGAPLLLAAPLGAWALGLGDIELQSALNQPFQAEIRLLSATPEELEGLQVGLASRETFQRYGLDRPAELSALVFEVARNGSGQDVIRISSRQSMADPFLTMLVEVTWPRGRRLREYTVLLDPPLFSPRLGAEPGIRQAQTSGPQPGAAGGAITRAPAPTSAVPGSAPAAAAPAVPPSQTAASSGGTYGPVQRAETLWNIATQLRPADVSVNQMMVALYESNPRAFDGNMNVLRSGTTLTVPERDRLLALSAAAATAEVRRHETSWQPRGQSAEAAETEPQQARLRLVPTVTEDSAAGGAEAGAGGASAAQSGQSAASSDADVQRLEGEVAALRSELENSRRLLELRNEQLQDLQAQLGNDQQQPAEPAPVAAATPAAPGVDLESEQLFADEPEPPVAATDPEPQTEAEPVRAAPAAAASAATVADTSAEPSLLSRVLGWISNPLLLIGFGVGAMLLTAVWYLRHRREEDEDVTGRWEALEAEVQEEAVYHEDTARLKRQVSDDSLIVDEGPRVRAAQDDSASGFMPSASSAAPDFEDVVDDTLSSQSVINLDQADFLAEADFHMAYGLYDQAAELVTKAIEKEPARLDLRLKLLEVYFVWGNKEAFLEAARALRAESGDRSDSDWDKVLIMGKQICPDEPMFAESAAGGAVDLDLHGDGSTELDFAFDEKESAGLDLDFGSSSNTGVDLELAATGERMGTSEDEDDDEIEYDLGESLDIGAQTAAGLEAALFQDDDQDDDEVGRADKDEAYGGSFDTDTDIEIDGMAETQESPTVENPRSGSDHDWSAFSAESETIEEPLNHDAPTVETPTVETAAADVPTVETYGPEAPTVETPTIESAYGGTARMKAPEPPTAEMFSGGQQGMNAGEHTEEIDLDDLGLSIDDLADLPDDIGELPRADDGDSDTREQPALVVDDDDDLLSATGVTQVLTDDDELEHMSTALLSEQDATMLAPGHGPADDTMRRTEVINRNVGSDISGDTSQLAALDDDGLGGEDKGYGGNGLDLDLEDLAAALHDGDTVEQPGSNSFERDVFGGDESTPIDLDIGMDLTGSDDPTSTEDAVGMDPQTMTEIGTKLDLARAYIDMGDPEGARSILEEVLDEGDTGQKREAQGLIDVLTA